MNSSELENLADNMRRINASLPTAEEAAAALSKLPKAIDVHLPPETHVRRLAQAFARIGSYWQPTREGFIWAVAVTAIALGLTVSVIAFFVVLCR